MEIDRKWGGALYGLLWGSGSGYSVGVVLDGCDWRYGVGERAKKDFDWIAVLARVRGELPPRSAQGCGMVPLSPETAWADTDTANSLRFQTSAVSASQRSHPRAKRNQIPGSRHPGGRSPLVVSRIQSPFAETVIPAS